MSGLSLGGFDATVSSVETVVRWGGTSAPFLKQERCYGQT